MIGFDFYDESWNDEIKAILAWVDNLTELQLSSFPKLWRYIGCRNAQVIQAIQLTTSLDITFLYGEIFLEIVQKRIPNLTNIVIDGNPTKCYRKVWKPTANLEAFTTSISAGKLASAVAKKLRILGILAEPDPAAELQFDYGHILGDKHVVYRGSA